VVIEELTHSQDQKASCVCKTSRCDQIETLKNDQNTPSPGWLSGLCKCIFWWGRTASGLAPRKPGEAWTKRILTCDSTQPPERTTTRSTRLHKRRQCRQPPPSIEPPSKSNPVRRLTDQAPVPVDDEHAAALPWSCTTWSSETWRTTCPTTSRRHW